ncbi:Lin1244/Lin1753 domain-containing protein [Lentilactobacillus sp. SPB1-3]|uniref:Lin1244/Lin1753 domain-containing protein n=1 Tax=Lentilactobacillus terminaliae TaxID=3003483 RepID=A0ACD5DDY8_9LACO|nr:Lin1244/Lin1753 domain-containing protein [Lentilactobacillus sp. SPB1-3]MCZ0978009.1 DUF4373 domain-containing protein [Lentilactobacillus sp. SPB1-3]
MNGYFSHDSNARNSEELLRVRMKYGAEGYGVYFMILERLRDEEDYMSVKDYNMIAFDLRVDASVIKSVIEDFGLFVFTDDGKYFYSEGFKKRMALKDERSKTLSDKRRKAAKTRWEKDSDANAMHLHSKSNANALQNDAKESKEKKREVKESKASKLASTHTQENIVDLWQELWGFPNSIAQQEIPNWIDASNADVVYYALQLAGKGNVPPRNAFKFIERVLTQWEEQGIKTLKQAQEANKKHEQRSSNAKGGRVTLDAHTPSFDTYDLPF